MQDITVSRAWFTGYVTIKNELGEKLVIGGVSEAGAIQAYRALKGLRYKHINVTHV